MCRHGENIYRRKDGRYEGRYIVGKTDEWKTRFGYVYGYQYMEVRRKLAEHILMWLLLQVHIVVVRLLFTDIRKTIKIGTSPLILQTVNVTVSYRVHLLKRVRSW